MRLWAEERNSGSIELLMTFPITLWQAVVGKFLAAWCFAGIALLLTFPVWITVNTGFPQRRHHRRLHRQLPHGRRISGHRHAIGRHAQSGRCVHHRGLGRFRVPVGGLSAGARFSRGVLPQTIVDAIASLSFFTHFDAISKGVIDLRDLVYFAALIAFWFRRGPGTRHEEGGISERESLAKTGDGRRRAGLARHSVFGASSCCRM